MNRRYTDRLLVDFNDIRDGVVGGLTGDFEGVPNIGDRIIVHDLDNEAEADIIEIKNRLILAQMDWDTWR